MGNMALQQGAWKIGSVMGIPIRLHFSWFIILGLITWSLSSFYFPEAAPDLPLISYWLKGALAALLLFASVAFHELAHSYVAQRYRMTILSITLFIFGGVAQMKGEPPNPKAEFRIALAGPLSSFFLALIFFLPSQGLEGTTQALFAYLARINLILGIFNLIPGFPMDGGRLLRSFLWARKKDYFSATRTASGVGKKIGLFFIVFGLLSFFTGFPGGLWLLLIGWFVYSAAQSSYQQATLQEVLSGVKVKDVMVKAEDMVILSPAMTIEEAVNEYFLRYGYGGFPVMDDGKFLGIVTLKEIKNVPRDRWGGIPLADIAVPHDQRRELFPQDDIMRALQLMIQEDEGRIVVTKNSKVVGWITRNGIARYVQVMGR
jgi:Zn-dependent protease/predicted transcriptional regulator